MNALEVLERGGVRVYLEGDSVKVRGPRSVLTPDVLEGVRASKDELFDSLFEREERAALMAEATDNSVGDAWSVAATHPVVLALCEAFAPLGVEVVSAKPFHGGSAA